MTRTLEDAIAAAAEQSRYGPRFDAGMCLREVRRLYGVGALYPSAAAAWDGARLRHPAPADLATIPRGVPVFWAGGAGGFGHVAVSTGDGRCWSTDILRPGYFDHVPLDEIRHRWGLRLVGWSADLNGVTLWAPPAPETRETRGPAVDDALEDLARARRRSRLRPRRLAAIRKARKALAAIRPWKVPK